MENGVLESCNMRRGRRQDGNGGRQATRADLARRSGRSERRDTSVADPQTMHKQVSLAEDRVSDKVCCVGRDSVLAPENRERPSGQLLLPLKLAIIQSGRSQDQIALSSEIDPTLLSRIVNGWRIATPEQRQRIAAALGRSVSDVFSEAA
jgi:hypothetical protein